MRAEWKTAEEKKKKRGKKRSTNLFVPSNQNPTWPTQATLTASPRRASLPWPQLPPPLLPAISLAVAPPVSPFQNHQTSSHLIAVPSPNRRRRCQASMSPSSCPARVDVACTCSAHVHLRFSAQSTVHNSPAMASHLLLRRFN